MAWVKVNNLVRIGYVIWNVVNVNFLWKLFIGSSSSWIWYLQSRPYNHICYYCKAYFTCCGFIFASCFAVSFIYPIVVLVRYNCVRLAQIEGKTQIGVLVNLSTKRELLGTVFAHLWNSFHCFSNCYFCVRIVWSPGIHTNNNKILIM